MKTQLIILRKRPQNSVHIPQFWDTLLEHWEKNAIESKAFLFKSMYTMNS